MTLRLIRRSWDLIVTDSMVKRSIEQEIRNKNFGARSGNFEKNAVVKNQGTKQRVPRILGDCWMGNQRAMCERRQL